MNMTGKIQVMQLFLNKGLNDFKKILNIFETINKSDISVK